MDVFVGSIDQGTASTRFVIFDGGGRRVASHQVAVGSLYPRPGWHEQDPLALLSSVETCIDEALQSFLTRGHAKAHIRTIGLANQRETLLTWDTKTGEPLHNAMVWSDTRTASLVRQVKSRKGADLVVTLCGRPASTSASAIKLVWLLCNVEAVARAYDAGRLAVGTVDSWLIYRLNGGLHREGGPVYVTDVSNASRTMWMNIRTREYDDELLSFFGVDAAKLTLPTIHPSSHPTAFGSLATGPLAGTRITGCLGDQSAALIGHGALTAGSAKNTYGTGCFLLYNVGPEPVISTNGLHTTVAYDLGNGHSLAYALEGSVPVAGSGISFLVNLGFIDDVKAIDALAASKPPTGSTTPKAPSSG
ncbi:putative GUT1-glycerol kinase [Ophiocordyceps camponoti-floridani]|uniref:glycerol kinase n=1 Tax=Ophiocordyceps camponoti-floridani TaxID=2030778 RepID=A0A8H4QE87_9HYPO|nr:putative GUT1-glycerol kinase [Ophiocordyceps camponoti-floridani]